MAIEGKVNIDVGGKGLLGGISSLLSGGGGLGDGAMAPMIKLVGIVGGIAAGIAILVSSSKMLQGVLKGIGRILMLILKPIGDILGIALLPIFYLLKPIAMFFNTMMKPFLIKATLAMRSGATLMKAGEPELAQTAFMTGFGYLIEPLLSALFPDSAKERMDNLDFALGTLLGSVVAVSDNQTKQYGETSNLIKKLEDMGIATDSLGEGFGVMTGDVKALNERLGTLALNILETVAPAFGIGTTIVISALRKLRDAIDLTTERFDNISREGGGMSIRPPTVEDLNRIVFDREPKTDIEKILQAEGLF